MQSFIVLGILPGTDIQTNLNFWITVTVVLTILAARHQLNAMRKFLRRNFSIRRLTTAFERYEFFVVQ